MISYESPSANISLILYRFGNIMTYLPKHEEVT